MIGTMADRIIMARRLAQPPKEERQTFGDANVNRGLTREKDLTPLFNYQFAEWVLARLEAPSPALRASALRAA